jgi:hypothetical protein
MRVPLTRSVTGHTVAPDDFLSPLNRIPGFIEYLHEPDAPMTAFSADDTKKPMIRDVRVIDDLDQFFESLTQAIAYCEDSTQQKAILQQFDDLRKKVIATADQHQATEDRSEAIARAQADATVFSAEIINELEETRLRLYDALATAEKAASDTQRLADTIFARTHDNVLVLHNGVCVSCNGRTTAIPRGSRLRYSAGVSHWSTNDSRTH